MDKTRKNTVSPHYHWDLLTVSEMLLVRAPQGLPRNTEGSEGTCKVKKQLQNSKCGKLGETLLFFHINHTHFQLNHTVVTTWEKKKEKKF